MGSKASKPGALALRLAGRLGGAVLGTSLAGPLGTALGAMAVGPICDLLASEEVTGDISEALGSSVEAVTANLSTDWISAEWRKQESSRDAALNEDLARALISALRDAVAELPDVPGDVAAAWDKRFKWTLKHPEGRRDFLRDVARQHPSPGEWDQAFVGRLNQPDQLVDWLWADIRRELESAAAGAGADPSSVHSILDRPDVRETVTDKLQSAFGKALLTDDAALKKLQYYMQLVLLGRLDRQDAALERISDRLTRCFEDLPERLAGRIAEELREQFTIREQFVFYSKPRLARSSSFGAAFQPFYFAQAEDDFIGREELLDDLDKQLFDIGEDAPAFRWAAICGDAGSGKSRLALHILETERDRWPLSGFVRSEFLRDADLARGDLSDISGPTLFVIDYAGSAPEACCRFLERCALFSESAPHPVRALLLLRRSNDRFFEVVARGDDDAIASNTQAWFDAPPERENDTSGALFLGSLSAVETETLMRRRIARTFEEEGYSRSLDDVDLLPMLRRYDESMRPLFAIMVADLFARGVLPQEDEGEESQEESRLALFWDYLDHQYKKRWSNSAETGEAAEARDQVDRHLTFLALSTMCRGLTDEAWTRIFRDAELGSSVTALLPRHPDDFDSPASGRPAADFSEDHTLATLSGSWRSSSDDPYPILEPDLVGEALVLLMLEKGKRFVCGNARTADHRRRFLPQYAWAADPDVARFVELAAQDFPERVAQLNWLLPEKPRPEMALERARLFRSLALTAIAPLQTRPATEADVARMERLLNRFPRDADGSEEAQQEWAAGIVDIAGQLAFIINRTAEPSRGDGFTPIQDKQARNHVFSEAAAPGEEEAAPPNTFEPTAVARQPCDAPTVAAALRLLRQLHDASVRAAIGDGPLRLRRLHAEVVGRALVSVFWKYRHVRHKHGHAAAPLSSDERAAREQVPELTDALMESEELDEDSLTVASTLTRLLIYAEHGENHTRGSKTFQAIQRLCDRSALSRPESVAESLRLLGNYSFLRIKNQGSAGDDADNKIDLADVAAVAQRLFDIANELEEVPEARRRAIADGWCSVGTRVGGHDHQLKQAPEAHFRRWIQRYVEFLETQGTAPLTSSVLDAYNLLFQAREQSEQNLDEVLQGYARIALKHGFDRTSLGSPHWDSLQFHLSRLRRCSAEAWPELRPVFETALEQIGERARRDLGAMLMHTLPDARFVAERDDWLVQQASSDGEHQEHEGTAARLRVTLFAQHLFDGDDESARKVLEASWNEGEDDEALEQSTEALLMLRTLVLWHGASHPAVKPWRRRLLQRITPAKAPLPRSQARRRHDKAALAAAASFARVEIDAGLSSADWLERNSHDD